MVTLSQDSILYKYQITQIAWSTIEIASEWTFAYRLFWKNLVQLL